MTRTQQGFIPGLYQTFEKNERQHHALSTASESGSCQQSRTPLSYNKQVEILSPIACAQSHSNPQCKHKNLPITEHHRKQPPRVPLRTAQAERSVSNSELTNQRKFSSHMDGLMDHAHVQPRCTLYYVLS